MKHTIRELRAWVIRTRKAIENGTSGLTVDQRRRFVKAFGGVDRLAKPRGR